MQNREDRKKELRAKAQKSMMSATAELAEDLEELNSHTLTDLDELRPVLADTALYDSLIAAVEESRKRNESIRTLKERLTQIGISTIHIAQIVAKIRTV